MGYTVKWHGVEIAANTADEAVNLAQKLAGITGPELIPPRHSQTTKLANPEQKINGDAKSQDALRFLSAIEAGQENGVDGETLCSVLHVSKPKAIGAKSAVINRVLDELGYRPEQVYINPRTLEGRIWRAGPMLSEAIQAVKGKM